VQAIFLIPFSFLVSIRVKRSKSSADCRLPTAFISQNLLCPGAYLRQRPTSWPTFANAPLVAGYRLYPPCRVIFSSSTTPTAPLRSAFLASRGCRRFHLDRNCPQQLANADPLNGPGAYDDANDDDNCCLGPPCGACEDAYDDLTAILTIEASSRRLLAVDPYICLKLHRL
jgi:hypothetical protein